MATVLRAWKVDGGKLIEIPELRADEQGLVEQRLEGWLASEPDAIEDNLLIIGRQVNTASGPLDLLGLTSDGRLVVVELKRDRAPRETVAQAIDYASWIASQTPEDIRSVAATYLGRPLEDVFQEKFGEALPEIQLKSPSILVVASRLDASTERMIEYLAQQYGMDIDGLVFRYLAASEGTQLLVRTSVVSEERRISATTESYRVPPETLLTLARDRKIIPIVSVLRRLSEFLSEEPARSYGGSFRYWQNRMLCGVNVASYWGAPDGEIDVWVSYGSWAQATGLAEESFIDSLKSGLKLVRQYEGNHQIVMRIKSEIEGAEFVGLLRGWLEVETSLPSPEAEEPTAGERVHEGSTT